MTMAKTTLPAYDRLVDYTRKSQSKRATASPFRSLRAPRLAAVAWLCMATGCSGKVVIATWSCRQQGDAATQSAPSANDAGDALEFWSTGFEDGFCDYLAGGFCTPDIHNIVPSPVHNGHYAAAYTVTSSRAQSRCFRQGVLPQQAYYSAWYYVPAVIKADIADNWNIIHFQEIDPSNGNWATTWDVLLANDNNAGLRMEVWNELARTHPDMGGAPSIPIGRWFQIEVFLKRAMDNTGEFSLFQDKASILHLTGLPTELSPRGQWYVGNYWYNLPTSESTGYVDDVSVGDSL
jgi:hypothetical protein